MTLKSQILRMRKHVACLRSRAKSLQCEQDRVQRQLAVLEGLVLCRDAMMGALAAIHGDGRAEAPEQVPEQLSVEDELLRLLGQAQPLPPGSPSRITEHQHLPMAAFFLQIDRSLCARVVALTPEAMRTHWCSIMHDATQLLALHQHDPSLAEPLLLAHMTHSIAWLAAMWVLNPQAWMQLQRLNLLTGQKESPPPGHHQAVLAAAGLSAETQQQIMDALLLTTPRLKQLQEQRQVLVGQLQELQQAEPLPPGGGSAALSPPATQGSFLSTASWYAAAASGSANSTCPVPPGNQPGVAIDAAARGAGAADADHSSNRGRQQRAARMWELVQQLQANCRSWMVVISTRANFALVLLTPLQVARVFVTAMPYVVWGAALFDELMAANQP